MGWDVLGTGSKKIFKHLSFTECTLTLKTPSKPPGVYLVIVVIRKSLMLLQQRFKNIAEFVFLCLWIFLWKTF